MMAKRLREKPAEKRKSAAARRSKFIQMAVTPGDDEESGFICALAEDGSVWVYEGATDQLYDDDTKVLTGWTRLRYDTKRN
jgi:hypothetical protein